MKNFNLKQIQHEKKKFKNKVNFEKYKLKRTQELLELNVFLKKINEQDYKLVKIIKLGKRDPEEKHKKSDEDISETGADEVYELMDKYKIRGRTLTEPIFIIMNSLYIHNKHIFREVTPNSKLEKHIIHYIDNILVLNIKSGINKIEKCLRYKPRDESEQEAYNERRKDHFKSREMKKITDQETIGKYNEVKYTNTDNSKLINKQDLDKLLIIKNKTKEKKQQLQKLNDVYDKEHGVDKLDRDLVLNNSFIKDREVAYIKMKTELVECSGFSSSFYGESHGGKFLVRQSTVHSFNKSANQIYPLSQFSSYNNRTIFCQQCANLEQDDNRESVNCRNVEHKHNEVLTNILQHEHMGSQEEKQEDSKTEMTSKELAGKYGSYLEEDIDFVINKVERDYRERLRRLNKNCKAHDNEDDGGNIAESDIDNVNVGRTLTAVPDVYSSSVYGSEYSVGSGCVQGEWSDWSSGS